MTRNTALPLPLRVISGVTAIVQILTAGPAHVWAQDIPMNRATAKTTASAQSPHASSGPTGGKISEARIVKVAPAHISDRPSAAEIIYAKVFPFPLIPIGTPSDDENITVAKAIIAFRDRPSKDDMSGLRTFINTRLWSAWTPSLLHQLGVTYLENGYFSLALDAWEQAWKYLNKGTFAQGSLEQSLADEVFSRLITANLRLGQKQRVRELIEEEAGDSKLGGPATQALNKAMELLHYFDTKAEENASCGLRALNANGRHQAAGYKELVPDVDDPQQIADYIANGISLPDLAERAPEGGINYQMAFRSGDAAIPTPAVIHWKFGHYSALTEKNGDLYRLEDPYLGFNNWVSAQALTAEGSGYYLVPKTKTLPAGWRSVSSAEGQKIRGRHCTHGRSEDGPVPDTDCPPKSGVTGLARYSFELLQAGLLMKDIPIGYSPPRGPSVYFDVKYRQRMSFLPGVPTFSNFGKQWTCNWISFIQPTSVTTGNPPQIRLITAEATAYTYNYDSASDTYKSANSIYYGMTIRRNPDGSYEISNSDGSKQVFAQPDSSSPARVFLTAVYDAAGNSVALAYDGHIRLWKIYDALGSQATELFYEPDNGSIVDYQVRRIRDPFGREAFFAYNGSQLQSITDVGGLSSVFEYGAGDFISRLTTPYGATTFSTTASGNNRSIEAQDPAGAIERAEATDSGTIPTQSSSPPGTSITVDGTSVPFLVFNGNLAWRNTYYWNKKAMAGAGGDYNKAVVYHWLADNSGVTQPILESYKQPFEERVWFNYPGQTTATAPGTLAEPSKIARVIETPNGLQTQLTQISYNATGRVAQTIDPMGRKLAYDYDSNNLLDVLQIRQNRGAANETLFAATYNNQHRPLTATDAAGQVATYTYNSSGQVLSETRVRNGGNETTTWSYDGNGYLGSVTGPSPGSSVSFDYDGYGRVRTVTDSVGYALVYDYDNLDRLTKVTFPDGTFQQTNYNRLDPEQQRDRLGRWTYTMYDSLRQPAWIYDAVGRTTSYDWCGCGALNSITDGEGHKTSFTRDLQYRLTGKTYADNSSLSYIYESASGRLKSINDAKGQVTNYQYYIDDNLKQISYTGGNPPTSSVSFTYDPNYNRVVSMTDGIGATNYAYNPVGTLGGGRLASVDGPLTNDTVTYSYDEYGRVTNRSINGAGNSSTTVYDALGRATSVSNPLGSFNYAYVNATQRLDHVDYPNGQIAQYAYFGNTGDERLQEIWNKTSNRSTISKFDYTYDAAGNIKTWSQQADASASSVHSFGYDGVDQLLGDAVAGSGATQHQYSYGYDKAGNRTTEQIDSSVVPASYNNLNQLTSLGGNGQMIFEGTLSEPGTVAIAGGSPASTDGSNHFRLAAPVTIGSNSIPIVATDTNGNATSNHIQLTVSGNSSQTLSYDLNGNLLSDGTNTYEWDAANRLVAVNESGSRRSEFTYNGLSQRVKIVEKDNGSVTSTKQFVWCLGDAQPCEERDASNNVMKRFYAQGEQIGSTNYYYTRDHLGSAGELTDSSGSVQTRYDYDPYGRRTKLTGSVDADFGFTGHYYHQPSGLHLALYRAYDADLGRWISRDPIAENGGINLYSYVFNSPANYHDSDGRFVPLVVGIVFTGGVISGAFKAYAVYRSSGSAGDVAAAFGKGFLSGAAGTAAGLLAGLTTKNPFAIGGAAGLASSLVDQALEPDPCAHLSGTKLLWDTAIGALAGKAGELAPGLQTQGRLPDLLTPRPLSQYGPNSLKLIGQEALSGVAGETWNQGVSPQNTY